ncbi:hypothetical protein, partial [Metallibacterium sp.]|uniref:hypothetical protein n=1 Tax=Metallibacterium sp. TaxID=2940281 RepID=UPI002609E012
ARRCAPMAPIRPALASLSVLFELVAKGHDRRRHLLDLTLEDTPRGHVDTIHTPPVLMRARCAATPATVPMNCGFYGTMQVFMQVR